jgi:hypothetical protein
LHEQLRNSRRVLEDGELVTRQRAFGKNVDDPKWPTFHDVS